LPAETWIELPDIEYVPPKPKGSNSSVTVHAQSPPRVVQGLARRVASSSQVMGIPASTTQLAAKVVVFVWESVPVALYVPSAFKVIVASLVNESM
jgi:hypothetical protein